MLTNTGLIRILELLRLALFYVLIIRWPLSLTETACLLNRIQIKPHHKLKITRGSFKCIPPYSIVLNPYILLSSHPYLFPCCLAFLLPVWPNKSLCEGLYCLMWSMHGGYLINTTEYLFSLLHEIQPNYHWRIASNNLMTWTSNEKNASNSCLRSISSAFHSLTYFLKRNQLLLVGQNHTKD